MKIRDHRVATDAGEIFARSWRPVDLDPMAPTVPLFHDSLGSVELWRDFPQLLADRLQTR